MDNESLQSRLDEVEKKLVLLLKGQAAIQTVHDGAILRANARTTALTSIVRELCGRVGLPGEEFAHHLEVRTSFYHDQLLQAIRAQNPNIAGRVDNRNLDEVSTVKQFPPLFADDGEEPED